MTNVPLLTFFISVAIYGAIAAAAYPRVDCLFKYYHTERRRNGIVTLVLGNLTLGTGLLYIAQYGSSEGYIAYLVPLGVFFGYGALAMYTKLLTPFFEINKNCKSYIDFIIYSGSARPAVIMFLFLVVVVFFLLCAFELSVSSHLISNLVGLGPDPVSRAIVSLSILIVAVAYTWAGGLRATINTDWIQAAFVIASLFALVAIIYRIIPENSGAGEDLTGAQFTAAGLISVAIAIYNAIITQFYNILNISISTNYSAEKKVFVFWKTSIAVSFFLCFFVTVGLLTRINDGGAHIDNFIASLLNAIAREGDPLSTALASVIVAGFLALILSTLDATITVIQQLTWEIKQPGKTFSAEFNVHDVRIARKLSLFVGAIIAILTSVLVIFFSDAEIKSIVLAMIWPLTLCTPIIAISAYFSARHNQTILGRQTVRAMIAAITVLIWVAIITFTLIGRDVSAIANLLSVFAAGTFWLFENRSVSIRRTT